MAVWSRISWPQAIGTVRAPNRSFSMTGVRPDIRIIGTWSVAALMAPMAPLASPTLVCRITACALPVAK
jgi:hypothetical protein